MATLTESREVKLADSMHTWRIKHDEMLYVEDDLYVKLNTNNSSLSGIIGNQGGYVCLSRSHGYRELFQLRKEATERLQKDDDAEEGPNLFDDVKPMKLKRSRTEMAYQRQNPRSVTVMVAVNKPVVMLAHVLPTD